MGAGYSKMNDLTIIQTTQVMEGEEGGRLGRKAEENATLLLQGLASYLLEQFGQKMCEVRGVVIGYDARHNSTR